MQFLSWTRVPYGLVSVVTLDSWKHLADYGSNNQVCLCFTVKLFLRFGSVTVWPRYSLSSLWQFVEQPPSKSVDFLDSGHLTPEILARTSTKIHTVILLHCTYSSGIGKKAIRESSMYDNLFLPIWTPFQVIENMRLTSLLNKPLLRNGYERAVAKVMRLMSLKPINEIHFTFDPFTMNIKSAREAMMFLSSEKLLESNPRMEVRTKVVDDRSEPTMLTTFADGQKYLFRTANLSGLEIMEQLDRLSLLREPRRLELIHPPRTRGK